VKPDPVNIPLSWGNLTGLHWPRPGAPKVLCLHGWLDNAASFIPLAPYLGDFDLLALDFAGHGFSSHRPIHSRYYFSEYLYDLDAVLDHLAWDDCHIVGHSLGGGMGSNYAAAIPERVDRLVMLDTAGVIFRPADEAARQLCMSIKSVRRNGSNLRHYKSVADAVIARQGKSDLSEQAARLLCERNLEHTGEHYQWRTDPRLNWRSPQLMTNEQAVGILAAIRAPTMVISTPLLTTYLGEDVLKQRLAAIPDCEHVEFDGHHHFHMEQAKQTGLLISNFLQQQNQQRDQQQESSNDNG